MTDSRWTLDDRPGPARRLTADRAAAMIDAALDAAALPERIEVAAPEARPRRAGGMRLAMVAAVLLFAVGGASAGVYVYTRAAEPEPVAAPEPTPPPRRVVVTPLPEPEPEPEPEEIIELDPDPIDRAPAPEVERPRPAKDLLRIANQQRRDRQWKAAYSTYRQVMRQHRGTNAAYVATLGAADILLRKLGHPDAALRLYRQSVRAGGDLAQEARWGVVEAHRALGQRDRERAALDAFLDHHADAPMADRARARRAELDRE